MIRSLNIWLSACVLVAAVLGGAGSAEAQAKRVGIVKFEGQSASAVQAQVTQGLKQQDEVEIVSAREVSSAASRLGSSLSSDSDYQEVGEALELSALVEGEIERDRKGRDLIITVRVRNASTGEVVHEQTWKKRRSQVKQLRGLVWGKLGPAIEETSPAAPKTKGKGKTRPTPPVEDPEVGLVEPEPDEEEAPPPKKPRREVVKHDEPEEDEEEEQAAAPTNKSADHPALILTVGPRLTWRKLKYEGRTNLNSFNNSALVVPAVSLRYFPGAHVTNRWYSNLGLDVSFDYAIGFKTTLPRDAASEAAAEEVPTKAYELNVGAVYRVPLGDFEPRIHVGYLKQVFDIQMKDDQCVIGREGEMEDGAPIHCMPKIDYSAIRLGLGTGIRIVDWLHFDAAFAYLLVLGTGELTDGPYGKGLETSAWEASAGFLVRFKKVLGVRVDLDYRRYKYDFGLTYYPRIELPKSGTDGYTRLTLSLVYNLPGVADK